MRGLRAGWMRCAAVALALAVPAAASTARAQGAPATRVALVIGEGAYRTGPLPAAPDDAGLVAQVLAGAGFDVTGARDLDGDGLRRAFRAFLDRAGAAGPDGIAVVYFAGRAVQSDGDDYLVPVDARLARPADVPIEALRLADFTHALAALPIQARVVVVDGAYSGGAAAGGPPSGAPGLALVDAEQGELLAFNAAPGTVAPATAGPYGAYAQALVAAVKQGGVPVDEVFDRVRLAVNQSTGGAVVPWESDKLTRSFAFFDRAPGAPAVASAQVPFTALGKRPLAGFPPDQAYDVAVARDTLPAYVEFLAAFPDDPLARRVRLILAVRREALFWRAALGGNTPDSYWTYLSRYPKGPHAGDARRRLTRLAAAASPPPRFAPLVFDVPPPGPNDLAYDRVIVFDGPDLPPPPPPPVFLLPPLVEVVVQRPPPPPGPVFLPVPVPVAIPYVRPPVDPGSIAPPRGVVGDYPRPRPYARGPNGDGLVVQGAPAAPVQDARPRPAGAAPPPPAAPASAPSPRPAAPVPVPPAALPVPPQPPAPIAPRAPTLPAPPVLPTPPVAPSRPPPAPKPPAAAPPSPPVRLPPAPSALPMPPAPPAPPTPRPSHPAGAPAAVRDPQPAAPPPPAPAAPQRPAAAAPHLPAPAAAPEPVPHRPPPAAPKPDPAPPAPKPQPPAPQPSAPPLATPHPAPERAPEPPRPGPPPERPAAAAPAHPTAEHQPGEHRPACGHPGEPPCRP